MIIKANATHIPLKDESVHCVVTSPPYRGLRKYDIPDSIWDGDNRCEHEWGERLPDHHPGQVEQTKWKNADGAGMAKLLALANSAFFVGPGRGSWGANRHSVSMSHISSRFLGKFAESSGVMGVYGSIWAIPMPAGKGPAITLGVVRGA